MEKKTFINAMRALFPGVNEAAASPWIDFIDYNVSVNQYVDFETVSIPADKGEEAERWLDALFASFYRAKEMFGETLAAQVYIGG